MKKRLITVLMITVAMLLAACGTEDKDNTTEVGGTVVENPSVPVESVVEPETIPADEDVFEEIIGDEDIFMTMDDMEVKVVGETIEIVDKNGLWADFGMEHFELLFPRASFLIDSRHAETAGIKFDVAVKMKEGSPSFRLDDNVTVEEYNNYTLRTEQGRNSEFGFQKEYDIYNPNTDTYLYILLTIDKTQDEYQTQADELVEQFVPAFEEVLLNNLQ